MICLVCRGAQLVKGTTSITFERDEFRAVVHRIPAHVCPVCGESCLDEEVTFDLLNKVERIAAESEMDVVQDYD